MTRAPNNPLQKSNAPSRQDSLTNAPGKWSAATGSMRAAQLNAIDGPTITLPMPLMQPTRGADSAVRMKANIANPRKVTYGLKDTPDAEPAYSLMLDLKRAA